MPDRNNVLIPHQLSAVLILIFQGKLAYDLGFGEFDLTAGSALLPRPLQLYSRFDLKVFGRRDRHCGG
jgi:hypothetical protein